MNNQETSAANTLRSMVRWMNNTNEGVLDDYSVADLCKLYAAFQECDWDLTLDYWTERQLSEALESNIVPQWGANEQDPIYPEVPKKFD